MIGDGKIGKAPLQRFVSEVFKYHPRVAVVLETPVKAGSREAEMAVDYARLDLLRVPLRWGGCGFFCTNSRKS